jgi:hypothetical protein
MLTKRSALGRLPFYTDLRLASRLIAGEFNAKVWNGVPGRERNQHICTYCINFGWALLG